MKLTKLSIQNLLGIKQAEINTPSKIVFVSGNNGAGKSSIRDAVALAMTGDLSRVTLKKDVTQLVNDDGSRAGNVAVEINNDAQFVASIENGKLTGNVKEGECSPVLPYLLNAHLFASVSPDERRKLLFEITGCGITQEEVKKRLLARGITEESIDRILPFLRSGFSEAQKEAQAKAREAKASWKTVTGGETYGEKKAETWKAKATGNLEDIQNLVIEKETELTAVDADFETENRRYGAMKAAKDKAITLNADIVRLRDQADKIDRIKIKLEADRRDLKSWQAMVERTRQATHGISADDSACHCPECNAELIFVAKNKKLISHGDLRGDEDATVNLAEYERNLEIFEKSVKNDERDLANAETAKAQLSALEARAENAPSDEALISTTAKLDELKAQKRTLNETIKNLLAEERALREADQITAKAYEHHTKVIEWEMIADALAPDGIPGDILQEALKPFRNALVMTAGLAGWGTPSIDDDMNITVNNRPYGLLSESEKWRADCLMTEAISRLSEFRFFALDRMDVLDGKGRGALFGFLEEMASVDEIDTVLVMGTLKREQAETVANAFEYVSVYWMQNGILNTIEKIKEEAVA